MLLSHANHSSLTSRHNLGRAPKESCQRRVTSLYISCLTEAHKWNLLIPKDASAQDFVIPKAAGAHATATEEPAVPARGLRLL